MWREENLGHFRHVLNEKLDLSMWAVCRASENFFPPEEKQILRYRSDIRREFSP